MRIPACKFFLFTALLFFLGAINFAFAQRNLSGNDHPAITLQPDIKVYETLRETDSVNFILDQYKRGAFKPLKRSIINAGIANRYYWFYFSISNHGSHNEPIIINFDNSRINTMELYTVAPDHVKSFGKRGDFFNFSQRQIPYKTFIYPDTLEPAERKQYLLRVNQLGHTLMLPISVQRVQNFNNSVIHDYLMDGFTYGILLFVALLSLSFFFSSRYFLYLYYCLYILTAIAWFLSYFGLGYQILWGNYPFLNTAMAPVMASLNILLNIAICQVLLRLSKSGLFLNKLMSFTKFGLGLIAIFPLIVNLNNHGYTVNHTYLIVFLSAILISMLILVYAVINYALKGNIAARLYFAASILKAGSIINLALLELGITPAFVNMEGFLQIGIFVEITLLTFALALRYASFKSHTFIKVIEAHENERTIISNEIHDGISSALTGINYGLRGFNDKSEKLTDEQKVYLSGLANQLTELELEVRNISHNTMPDYVKTTPVTALVEKYIHSVKQKISLNPGDKTQIKFDFSYNQELRSFSAAVKLNIFRIIQEITGNLLKHSKASRADILFSFSKKDLLIIVEDNGIGINRDKTTRSEGAGIKNIKTRVALLNGKVEIKSPARKVKRIITDPHQEPSARHEYGTLFKIRIPYRNNANNSHHDY